MPLMGWLASCESDSTIGSSIVEDRITVSVDSSFTVSGHSAEIGKVQSRTISQLIGRINAKGFGQLSSDVVTQFMPAAQLDAEYLTVDGIDSLMLIMSVVKGEFVGDSVAPMGLNIYPLTRQLPSPIYSDFDPTDYYDANTLLASTVYNLSDNSAGVINKDGTTKIKARLPKSLARKLYTEYRERPQTFQSPTAFAEFFPGLYIENSYGGGRLTRVTSTLMTLYYHYNITTSAGRDSTVVKAGNYFAVTPEIITNNNISLRISPDIQQRVDQGEAIVLAPTGLEVNMRFPAPEIIAAYKANGSPVKVLNSLTFSVPGSAIPNDDDIQAPRYLLMVLESKKAEFFSKNALPDNITSFYATYNSTTGTYDFGEMRSYILDLMAKDRITEDDYTFSITPVSATFETSSAASSSYYGYYYGYGYGYGQSSQTLSMLTPYVAAPVMGRLYLDRAKIKLTFSTQTIAK